MHNYVCFYIEGLLDLIATGEPKQRDWPSSWAVGEVTNDEWQALNARLHAAYEAVRALPDATPSWDRMTIGGAIALVSHTSYHLGEIRLGLSVLRS